MSENIGTRRGFIVAAAATAVGSVAFAQSNIMAGGVAGNSGMIRFLSRVSAPTTLDKTTVDAWTAAIDTLVSIQGEHGAVTGRILSVVKGEMGGERPDTLRDETLVVAFETASAAAPDGNRTYALQTSVAGVRELFLTRGEDVLGRAILTAVLN